MRPRQWVTSQVRSYAQTKKNKTKNYGSFEIFFHVLGWPAACLAVSGPGVLHCIGKTSATEPEPQGAASFGKVGAATRYGLEGSGFKLDVQHIWIIKNVTNCNSYLL
jgi:hypothetical protein